MSLFALFELGTVVVAVASATLLTVAPASDPAPAVPAEMSLARAALEEPDLVAAWTALRTVYCERCHGKDYEGLAAPSIVAYARSQGREAFIRMVLDGDPQRGMPGYRGNALVVENIDGIWRYFHGRATGAIDASARPSAGR
jgi:hypothetical protein